MKKRLVIIGAGGHGKVAADIALKIKKWDEIVFLDDNNSGKEVLGFKVIGKTSEWKVFSNEDDFFVAIGNNQTRKMFILQLKGKGVNIATLIHPSAVIGKKVDIGDGTIVMAGSVINSCTKVGIGCIVNTCSSIDHDNNISDYVHISPGVHIAGNVSVGTMSWLGIGSTVINNIEITDNCMIGAGAVVINNIYVQGTYIGIPAVLRKN